MVIKTLGTGNVKVSGAKRERKPENSRKIAAIFPYGKICVLRNFLQQTLVTTKFRYSEIPHGETHTEMSYVEISCHGAYQTHDHIYKKSLWLSMRLITSISPNLLYIMYWLTQLTKYTTKFESSIYKRDIKYLIRIRPYKRFQARMKEAARQKWPCCSANTREEL